MSEDEQLVELLVAWEEQRRQGKDTTPEKVVRSLLHRMGYRFRLHRRIQIPQRGTSKQLARAVSVDIVLPKYKTAIFVHGCFWHRHRGCRNCTTPTSNRGFWLEKLNGNAARDKVHQHTLRELGWRGLVVWECETQKPTQLKRVIDRLMKHLSMRL